MGLEGMLSSKIIDFLKFIMKSTAIMILSLYSFQTAFLQIQIITFTALILTEYLLTLSEVNFYFEN